MKVISSLKGIYSLTQKHKKLGRKIALVPTMGALHIGHLSLIKAAQKACDTVIVSIFVNPTQFGPNEDYNKYPRNLKKDIDLLSPLKNVAVFAPSQNDMYPEGFDTEVNVGELSSSLCGAKRPGHFNGVATVVLKLFNLVQPDIAFFGLKDYQQQLIIKKMVIDLNLGIRIVACPTMREKDGLAISSRNQYLSTKDRQIAPLLYQALLLAKKKKSLAAAEIFLQKESRIKIDYLVMADANTLRPLKKPAGLTLIAIAARIGKTRLIDNLVLKP